MMQQSNVSSNQTTRGGVASCPTVEPRSMQAQPRDVSVHHKPGTDTDVAEDVYENDDVDDDDDGGVAACPTVDHTPGTDSDVAEDVYENDDVDETVYANDDDDADEHEYLDLDGSAESTNPPPDGGPAPGAPVRPFLSCSQWVCVAITASAAVAMLLTGLLITGPTESRQQNLQYPTAPDSIIKTTIAHTAQTPAYDTSTTTAYTYVSAPTSNRQQKMMEIVASSRLEGEDLNWDSSLT
ncbi:Hypp8849 [Branchiostoma lanceolatum]|uniref:Hypp8849 protein n=1 Tax=Branchiostoma lanceolatum TaxID=7740 RepID=A0A8K0EG52_BRALA|nr:Hypp8849 [Branchiostoma lanceolatum]